MSKLTNMMKFNKVTQVELAKTLKISQSAISQIAKKGITNLRIAEKYAVNLNCDPYLLLENIIKY